MRKLFFGLAALSMLFVAASCTNETIESSDDGKPLTFRTVLGKQTVSRAGEATIDTLMAKATGTSTAIPVCSFLTGSTTPFKDFDLYYSGDQWIYDGDPILQPGVALRYYSWYPDNVTAETVTTTGYSFDYTVKATAAVQEDLIGATITTPNAEVDLEFKHLLSQVNFGIVKTFGLYVLIDPASIKVNGVKNTGTYTFGSGWAVKDTPTTDYLYSPIDGTNETDGTVTGVYSYMGNGGSAYDKNNALMLMPQEFTTEGEGTITFDYKLWTIDENGDEKYLAGGADAYVSATANLCDFNTVEWVPGKRYLYLFDFSGYLGEQKEITFRVTVEPWINDNDVTVAETLQVTDGKLESIEAAIAKHSAANNTAGALKVFPIAVPVAIDGMTLTLIEGFDANDEIRIKFLNNTEAQKFKAELGGTWTRSLSSEGDVVMLTCVEPMDVAKAQTTIVEGNNADAIKANIQNAIQTAGADTDRAAKLLQIVVKGTIDGAVGIDALSNVVEGDRIRIVFDDETSAGNVIFSVSDWKMTRYDNIVLIEEEE